ncbi:hypothetical protein PFLUV_G00067750 [Perca fluviatilis]|uniref:Uncharacterized protein n=1 Tax=Perca fluviatilis TaxID=8168 RepID=A0A6A5FG47_PERFL|nr:hypothetical protein PFLUV_G00067750 [Perca fluviatilis]
MLSTRAVPLRRQFVATVLVILPLDPLLTGFHLPPRYLLTSPLRSQPAIPPSRHLRCLATHPPSDLRLRPYLELLSWPPLSSTFKHRF